MKARRKNPVRELKLSEAEKKRLHDAVERQLSGKGAKLRQAASLYTKFTGHENVDVVKAKIPDLPKEAVEVGFCDGILYTTVRDGVTEKYIHKFKKSARPLFCVSPDGKQLLLLGGAFTFGERGIVDN
jgi:hypothetical protein